MASSGMRFDMRRAPFSPLSVADMHREVLAMAAWADEHDFAHIVVSEHHGVDFTSAPLTMAAMILGRAPHLKVSINAVLLPLHDPVRVAEEIATIDLMSGGRLSVVVGLGYRYDEFTMAGVDRAKRGAIFEDHVRTMLQAWTGEPFTWRGRTVTVWPAPTTPALAMLIIGGSMPVSADRAARLRLGFCTMSTDPALGERYRAACAAEGFEQGFFLYPTGPSFVHVAEDPERAWAELAPYALYDATSYSTFQTGDHDNVVDMAGRSTVEELRASGMWQVLTPDECLALVERTGSAALHPLMGGIPPELGWSSLELYNSAVQPRIKG